MTKYKVVDTYTRSMSLTITIFFFQLICVLQAIIDSINYYSGKNPSSNILINLFAVVLAFGVGIFISVFNYQRVKFRFPTIFSVCISLLSLIILVSLIPVANSMSHCSDRMVADGNAASCTFKQQDFRNMDLSQINLRQAVLKEVNLSGTDLSGADLTGSRLEDVDLTGAILNNSILDQVEMTGAEGLTESMLADAFNVVPERLPEAIAQSDLVLDTKAEIESVLFPVCNGSGSSQAHSFLTEQVGHTMVLFNQSGELIHPEHPSGSLTYREWEKPLLEDWSPRAIAYTEVVICAQRAVEIKQTCRYGPFGLTGSTVVKRKRLGWEFNLYEAQSGELIGSQTIWGGEPEKCPKRIVSSSGHADDIEGSEPEDFDPVFDWIETTLIND